MSPITLFTVINCPYCKQVKVALEDCGLPFSEISLSRYPQKRKDLLRLTGCKVSVPQLFVQNKWIGGIDSALDFLRDFAASRWNAPQWLQETPLERLEREVGASSSASGGNSLNPRFMVPIMEEEEAEDTPCDCGCCCRDCEPSQHSCGERDDGNAEHAAAEETAGPQSKLLEQKPSWRGASTTDPVRIQCPDGSKLTVLQLTEKLKEILHYGKRRYQFTSYKNCCTAEEVVNSLVETYGISRTEATEFGKVLHQQNMLHHVCEDHDFEDTASWFFRLQCFHTPSILNSYRIWPSSSPPAVGDPVEVMARLTTLFNRIEAAVIGLDGNVNYRIAFMCSLFPAFEDAVCELQAVDLSNLEGADMMAFSLNVFNMMTKVVGWRFEREPQVTNHQDAGLLQEDPRIAFASKVGDVHAKDCRLHFAIHYWARSRRSPPVKSYSGAALEEELSFVAHAFCEEDDNVAYSGKEKKMRLAPVFRRYKSDFLIDSPSTNMPRVVLGFLYGTRRTKLERLLNQRRQGQTLKMSSRAEDWTLGMNDFVAFDSSQLKPNVRKVGKFVRKTTCPSSYRSDSSLRGGSLRSSAPSDNSTVSSARSSTPSIGLGRLLPKRRLSGGRTKRDKQDSIPKPFMRRPLDGDDRTISFDEMDSNVSNTSACSSNMSELVHLLDEASVARTTANRAT